MLIAVCCDRGAPGSTTTSLALGVSTPEPTVVVEADPYGGDLALRCVAPGGRGEAFPPTPTVLTLATEARRSADPGLAASKAHEFTESTRIVPGHLSAEQAAGVKDWGPLAEALRASASRVVADLGRIHSSSPTVPVAAAADVVAMVTRPEMGAVLHLKDRLERLAPVLAGIRNAPPVVVPVVVTPKRQAGAVVGEVARMLSLCNAAGVIAGIGWIAMDPSGVEAMYAGNVGGKNARVPLILPSFVREDQSRLLKSAGVLNVQINQAAGVEPYTAAEAAPADTYAGQTGEA